MRRRFFGATVLLVSQLVSNAFATTGIKNNPVLTSLDGFSSFDQQPVINSNGDVAFTAIDSGGTSGVYFYSAADKQTYRQDFGPVQPSKPNLAMNSGGQIAFVGDNSAGEAIYSKTATSTGGGTVITIQGNNFSQYTNPALLDDGSILFTALDGSSKDAGYFAASSGGQIITIFGASGLSFSGTGDLAANNSGSFAVAGRDPNDGSLGVYAGSVSGGSIITISGANFSNMGTLSAARSGSKLAWSGTLTVNGSTSSNLYIASLSGGSVITITGNNFGQATITRGIVAGMQDPTPASRSLQEYSSDDGTFLGTALSDGDPLDGSTITDFSIGPNSLNDSGEFVFEATLADGRSGIYVGELPEPTILAPLVGGILLMSRRRSGSRRAA
jgi:hypothetical protein